MVIIAFVHDLVSANYQLAAAGDSHINAASASALYGRGVFTTAAVFNGKPFLWEKHWRRLIVYCERIGIDVSTLTEIKMLGALDELIEKNTVKNGRARITIFDESATSLWPGNAYKPPSVLIMTGDSRSRLEQFRLGTSPYRINSASPLAGIKSCNYLEKIIAKDDAKQRGFDEAIQLNEHGKVSTGAMANVFWLRAGRMFTPALTTGCLAGTTREFVLENIDCTEVEVGMDELRSADAIFLTSAGLGIISASEFEGRTLTPQSHPLTQLLPDG